MTHESVSIHGTLCSGRSRTFFILCLICVALLPSLVFAQDASSACDTVNTFAKNVKGLLNGISIVVVTIAVIFSGYQIAFAHKRMGDVAPVLIGAVLIGAASQIANMFLGGDAGVGNGGCQAYVLHLINHYA